MNEWKNRIDGIDGISKKKKKNTQTDLVTRKNLDDDASLKWWNLLRSKSVSVTWNLMNCFSSCTIHGLIQSLIYLFLLFLSFFFSSSTSTRSCSFVANQKVFSSSKFTWLIVSFYIFYFLLIKSIFVLINSIVWNSLISF